MSLSYLVLRFLFVFLLYAGYAHSACRDGWYNVKQGWTCLGMLCGGASNIQCPDIANSVLIENNFSECERRPNQSSCSVVSNFDLKCHMIVCDDKCEADSIACKRSDGFWDSDNCECIDLCASSEEKCTSAGGKFTGRALVTGPGSGCCSAVCDMCNGEANENIVNLKTKYCCDAGFAPPPEAQNCYNPPGISGCGMTVLQRMTSDMDYKCRDPNSSPDASADFFNKCYGSSSSGANSSSSGAGSSDSGNSSGGGTSEGGGSSGGTPPYPEGCDECPWLDSILDTLTAQKGVVESIYNCVVMPSLCNSGTESVSDPFQFDTAWYNYVKPLLDTSLHLDTLTLEELEKLDTNMLKMLENDLEKLKNDTLLRYSLTAGFTQNSSDLANVRNEVNHMNDSTRKWLKRLADSLRVFNDSNRAYLDRVADTIGISTDSLIAHLDSIKRNIPRDVLDSILKYQKMLAESEDSVVLGSLPSIDSLIDSTVKYFKQAREFDSIRHFQMSDSLQALHEAIDGMSYRISQILGYGDTASTDLRGDLNSINSSVNTFRDSVIKYYGAFVSADSSYHVTFKDSVGSVHGTLNEIRDSLNGVSGRIVDGVVSGVVGGIDSVLNAGNANVQMGYLDFPSGDSLADLIGQDAGFNKLNVAGDTAALNDAINAPLVETDSTTCVGDDCIHYDSDKKIGDSLQNVIQRGGDSIKASNQSFYRDSMTSLISQVKDSIVAINPFGVFDSTLMKTLGAKVPNTNTCPEHCSHWNVDIPFPFGNLRTDLNYRLCVPWGVLGSLNVLQFLRFLIRCIVAVTCITMVMNAAARRR